ncbi:MAG: hypothetical protein ACI4V5_01865 [Prevotella sp.]
MWLLLISLLLAGIAITFLRRHFRRDDVSNNSADCTDCSICNGKTKTCIHEKIMTTMVADEPEYFDDEELDEFKGKEADGYTAEETALFAEVLYTMRQNEVAEWLSSLEKRGINLPIELRDEALMLIDN